MCRDFRGSRQLSDNLKNCCKDKSTTSKPFFLNAAMGKFRYSLGGSEVIAFLLMQSAIKEE
jgi:hypothetical protein